jgi:hypothetical protein
MMHRNEIGLLRTQLRELNIQYSALVRTAPGDVSSAKMDELRARRRLLMARIAEVTPHAATAARAYPAQVPLEAVVQAA